MEVSVKVQKIIKFAIYHTVLLISGGGVDEVLARFSFIEKIMKDANSMYSSSSVKHPQTFRES